MPRLAEFGLACAALLAAAAPAAAAPGSLYGGFGSSGVLLLAVGGDGTSAGNGIALAPSGDLRVAGQAFDGTVSKFALLRLDVNGSPASLATTLTAVGAEAGAAAIATQGDGRSFLAGYGSGGDAFGAARYLDDGSLDGGFGAGGTQQTPVGSNGDAQARAVALYPPDKYVAAGRALDSGAAKVAILRYGSDGSVDSGFNALFSAGDGGEAAANAVAVQGDGKVVAAGYARDGGVIKLAVMRRLGNGGPDSEFGNATGTVMLTIGDGREAIADALAVQPDGKLLVAGSARNGGLEQLMLARFNADGSPDSGFGSGGTVMSAVGDGDDLGASAVAVQPDGSIVVAGRATDSGGTNLLVARYQANGLPDTSFGTGGFSLVPLGDDGSAEASALVLQANRAVVTGYASDGGLVKTVLAGVTLADAVQPVTPIAGPAPDTTPPVLAASMTHKRFRVGRGTSAFSARKRAPIGTTFRYTLSEAARVTIRLDRAKRGVKRGKRCVKPRRGLRGKRCTRWVRVGRLVRESPRGLTRVPFNGRIKRKALPLGRYRAVLSAVDGAGNKSATRTLKFQVVRR
jgi:uncharacterized delta-60 repeat protein